MAVDPDAISRLMEQLTKDREAFIESTNKTHELLQETLVALKALSNPPSTVTRPSHVTQHQSPPPPASPPPPPLPSVLPPAQSYRRGSLVPDLLVLSRAAQRTTTADIEVESLPHDRASSACTGDSDSESDKSQSVFVQTPLQSEQYDMEGFRQHLWEYDWTAGGRAMLCGLDEDQFALQRRCIFPTTQEEAERDRSHLSHYSIYDVGSDGVPLDIRHSKEQHPTRALQIWDRIRSTNADPERRKAVGRIVMVREPSPKLFAALHYTMNRHFDMDELFDLLKHEDPGLMFPHRAFDRDDRRRRSFVITLEYFTIIGDMCKPMQWQTSDENETEKTANHIPISRCSSVIALSLEGSPISKVRNRDRRIDNKYGDVYDPFSPWRVLSIQAYPDWHATTDTHKPTNHYLNGPEAFLHTLQAEFHDARKRLKEVYNRVGELVEPPANFIFNSKVREALLFEDDKFTYSKKYFWGYQTLSIINQDITEMIESYRDTFRDGVWEGSNKIIWPGESSVSSRYEHWRKRMAKLKRSMEDEVNKLEYIKTMNFKKMEDIEALRENLFSGTSVMESRRSVEQTLVTIEQNRSVLLLTLVTIFFLPLTFVTSVFGMTNMDPTESYFHFGWAMIGICVPTYIFIGSLHTDAGLQFWQRVKRAVITSLTHWTIKALGWVGYHPNWSQSLDAQRRKQLEAAAAALPTRSRMKRTSSATRTAMNMRLSRDDSAASLSRLNSQDRERDRFAIPRPQATSGDVPGTNPLRHTRTRSSGVTFSLDKAARVQTFSPSFADTISVSPRTGSPVPTARHRRDVSPRQLQTSNVVAQGQSDGGMLSRFWRRRDEKNSSGTGTPLERVPSV